MGLQYFNTLTAKKEPFIAIGDKAVKMYTCGPTVYDYAHIGNFRAYVFEDLLRRYLKYKGFTVIQVMNLTDIDDKTIEGSQREGISLNEYTRTYIDAFFEDLDALNIERAEYFPRATEHIEEMIKLIQMLVDKNLAYESDGSIYYRIHAFPEYGKLSKKDIDKNIAGTRVDHDEYERDDARDFVLWKKHKEGEPGWDSPFGKGRPGWHIECSAMSMKYLGETFDIHTGGEDNIFPHHENEIAQSEGATGKRFVNYWLHCKFLLVNNEKMSKSKGNFYTLRDLVKKEYSPLAVRYVLLSHNYRHPLNCTLEGIAQAQASINRIVNCMQALASYMPNANSCDDCAEDVTKVKNTFEESLDDDLNIARALAAMFEFVTVVNKKINSQSISTEGKQAIRECLESFDTVLGVLKVDEEETPKEIQDLLEKRQEAREEKDFSRADELRDEIIALGWIIEDTSDGARVKKR